MQTQTKHQIPAQWYIDLKQKAKILVDKHAFSEDQYNDIWELIVDTARTQYMDGNRAGINWERNHPV